MKNSFVLYSEYKEQFSLLSNEEAGKLIMAIFEYTESGNVPDLDGMALMAFSFIKKQLDRDSEKYEKTVEKRREAGKNGGRPKANGFSEKAKKANGFFEKQTKAKKPDNDNEDVNVNENVNEKDKKENIKEKRFAEGNKTHTTQAVKEIVGYLNEVCGTGYKENTPQTVACIKARLKEGFSVEDFKTVIDKKHEEWQFDGEMAKFLRPQTLFGTKFESYLNQPVATCGKLSDTDKAILRFAAQAKESPPAVQIAAGERCDMF